MDRREAAALDRHITGNFGEDQFAGCLYDEWEDYDLTPVCQVGNCDDDAVDGVLCQQHLDDQIRAQEEWDVSEAR